MMFGRWITRAEMASQLGRLDTLIGKLDNQLEAHETWHRDMLIRSGDQRSARSLAALALAVAIIGALSGVAAAVAAFLR